MGCLHHTHPSRFRDLFRKGIKKIIKSQGWWMAFRYNRVDIHINSQRLGKLIQDLHTFEWNKVPTQIRGWGLDKSPTVMRHSEQVIPSGKREVSSLQWSDTESVNISWLRVTADDQDGSTQNWLPIFVIFVACTKVWSFCLWVFVFVVFYCCYLDFFENRERENMGGPGKSCRNGKYMIKIYCIKILKANFKCIFKTGNF